MRGFINVTASSPKTAEQLRTELERVVWEYLLRSINSPKTDEQLRAELEHVVRENVRLKMGIENGNHRQSEKGATDSDDITITVDFDALAQKMREEMKAQKENSKVAKHKQFREGLRSLAYLLAIASLFRSK